MAKKSTATQPKWEYKDRLYILKTSGTPVSYTINSKHSRNHPLQYFDGSMQRPLRYATNQQSIFMDEQMGDVIIGRITFLDGKLKVPKEDAVLQQFLSIYHPGNGKLYFEFDPEQDASEDISEEYETLDALNMIRDMEISDLEAVARAIFKSKVASMTSSEIRRDMLMFAKNNPQEFISLANDENLKLRNLAIRAQEFGIIKISDDNRTVTWNNKTKDKIITVPFGENAYSALASFFKTDEGNDVLQGIQNKL
jgi:hypothetical protein